MFIAPNMPPNSDQLREERNVKLMAKEDFAPDGALLLPVISIL